MISNNLVMLQVIPGPHMVEDVFSTLLLPKLEQLPVRMQQHLDTMAAYELKAYQTVGDGNCFFRSVSLCINGMCGQKLCLPMLIHL